MKQLLCLIALATSLGLTAASAETAAKKPPAYSNAELFTTAARPFRIVKADPALDAIVSPTAKLVSLGDRFGLTEGPVWVPEGAGGYLLVSDLIENVIYKIAADGVVSVFLENAGYSGDDINHAGFQTRRGRGHVVMIGPNGETLDAQGRLIWCASNDGTVMRLEKDGSRTVLASGYQGKRFSGPNDLAIRSDGGLYMTDSDWGLRDGAKSPLKQLPFNGVYLIKDGKVTLLVTDQQLGGVPNGVALSPDEKHLYLSAGFAKMMRYDVLPDGTIANGQVFFQPPPAGFGDGMKTDVLGNLYSTGGAGPGVVRITSPTGKYLGQIDLPVYATEPKRQICGTNLAFGGPDGRTLYVTACEAVYRIELKIPGSFPGRPADRIR